MDVIEYGRLRIYKYPPNVSIDLELGDRVSGVVENTLIKWAIYIGGDYNLLTSYLIINGPGANNSPLENQYDTINGVDQLLEDQANQTQGFYQFVADAGDDPTVEAGEPAVYYYLGTTNQSLNDYIKLSNDEYDQLQFSDYQTFKVKQVSESIDDACSIGQILVQTDAGGQVTQLLFDSNYSKLLDRNRTEFSSGRPFFIRVDNNTKFKRSLYKVTEFQFSNVSNQHYVLDLSDSEDTNYYEANDVVSIHTWHEEKRGWLWIDGSWVEKDAGNDDLNSLEVNDIVYFKDVTFGSNTITLRGHRYDGPDPGLQSSYTKVKSMA